VDDQATTLLRTRLFTVVGQDFDPSHGVSVQRQWVRHPGAVVIVPLVDEDRVCLIRNHRLTLGKTLIELPAGTRDPDESPEATAARELAEETGFRAASWTKLHEFFTSPGILDERMFLFLATGLVAGVAAREPGEEIENLIVSWDEAVSMAIDGRIEDGKTLVALLLWDSLRRGRRSSLK
jgi:ADP-ribose pyrophosphatase